jgi:flagellar hook-length control protein FliK
MIRLNPPELGMVFIKFQEQNTELSGFLEVSKTETKFEIEQALPEIIRNLTDCDIQIKRLDVTLSEEIRSNHEALSNQWLQNNEHYEQDSANSEARADDSDTSGINEWLPDYNSYRNTVLPQESLITNGSFNILI